MRMNMGELREYKQKSIIMKPTNNSTGYLKVRLTHLDGSIKNHYIHRLVATHFIENDNLELQVNHIDGDKHNNKLSNLEWCTAMENMNHSFKFLKRKINTDGINPPSPVVQIDINTEEIIATYPTISEAQKLTGISHISCVCRGERKSAGGYFWKYN